MTRQLSKNLLAALVASALAACGSTVEVGQSDPVVGLSADAGLGDSADGGVGGLEVPGDGRGPAVPDGLQPGTGGSGTGSSGTGTGAPRQGRVGPTHSASERPDAFPVSGRGYDAKHVYIGFNTIDNLHTFSEAFGLKGLDFGDMRKDAEAVIAEVNRSGGILGRRVVGVYHDEDVSEATTNPSVNAQKTCTAFTQDRRVIAAVINNTVGDDNDTFYGCMRSADTPFFTGAALAFDRKRLDEYKGYLHLTNSVDWTVFAPVFIERLTANGYFSPWDASAGAAGHAGTAQPKVGLLWPDTSTGRRISAVLARLLSARGVPSYQYLYADASQGVGAMTASIQNAVVPMRGNNVTHLITDGPSITIFAPAAESQRYRPRYGVQTLNVPYGSSENVPEAQYNGAMGVGWNPALDVNAVEGDAATSCLRNVSKMGENYRGESQPTAIALFICDSVRLLAQALNAAGGLSSQALSVGVTRVLPTFKTSVGFRAPQSPGRVDLVGAVRDIRFQSNCSCFAYTSKRLWTVE